MQSADFLATIIFQRNYNEFHCQRNFFLLSSFKYANNRKTFVCDPTTFLHYQIEVYGAHARILASGYKNAFSMLHVHGLVIFQNRAQIQNLCRMLDECMGT